MNAACRGDAPPTNRRVGTWTTRSGNACTVDLAGGLDTSGLVTFAWDRLPLSRRDLQDYDQHILPLVLREIGQLLERPGAALVVRL